MYEVVTFDCYGTLIDWEAGISQAFVETAARDGVALEREAVVRVYAEVEREIERGPYRPYWQVLMEAAAETAVELGWELPRPRAAFLAESLSHWPAFPDTNPGLRRLAAAGYRLGILSNVDNDLLALTRRHLAVPFDVVVTAEQVSSYKPAHAHFLEARKRIGDRPWLHAAQSWFHDVVPASELGIPVAWVNRRAESARRGARPQTAVGTIVELADWLGAPQAAP